MTLFFQVRLFILMNAQKKKIIMNSKIDLEQCQQQHLCIS